MTKIPLMFSLALIVFAPAVAAAEEGTKRYGGLISLLYPERYTEVEHVSVDWVALDAQPLAVIEPIVATPTCARQWKRGQEEAVCEPVFVPLRSADSGAFVEKPRFLSTMRSFSYGTDSKTAFGMDLPGLVETLRARTRTSDFGLNERVVENTSARR
ncbi:MAG: hypothetical protein AB3N11_02485 [Arenibacterium sp.]